MTSAGSAYAVPVLLREADAFKPPIAEGNSMSLNELSDSQYKDLVAVIDGQTPLDPHTLERAGLIEPITQTNLEAGFLYRLTADGRKHYTLYRERVGTDNAHLE